MSSRVRRSPAVAAASSTHEEGPQFAFFDVDFTVAYNGSYYGNRHQQQGLTIQNGVKSFSMSSLKWKWEVRPIQVKEEQSSNDIKLEFILSVEDAGQLKSSVVDVEGTCMLVLMNQSQMPTTIKMRSMRFDACHPTQAHKHAIQVQYWQNTPLKGRVVFNAYRSAPLATTFSCSTPYSNVVLNVDGKQFYYVKEILASASDYFETMFFGESKFSERERAEVKIGEVKAEDFEEFLRFLHPANPSYIYSDTVLSLLAMAERFQALSLKAQCESFLVGDFLGKKETMSKVDYLVIACRYNLDALLSAFLSTATAEELRTLFNEGKMKEMPTETHMLIISQLLKFNNTQQNSNDRYFQQSWDD